MYRLTPPHPCLSPVCHAFSREHQCRPVTPASALSLQAEVDAPVGFFFCRSAHLQLQSAWTKGKCARLLLHIIEESYFISDRETGPSAPSKLLPSRSPGHQAPRGYFVLSDSHWMVVTVPASPVCDRSWPSTKECFLLRRTAVLQLGMCLSLWSVCLACIQPWVCVYDWIWCTYL